MTAEGGAETIVGPQVFSVLCGAGTGTGMTQITTGAYSASLGAVQRVATNNGSGTTTRFELPSLASSSAEAGCAISAATVRIIEAGSESDHASFANPATKVTSGAGTSFFAIPSDIGTAADLTFRIKLFN